MSDSSSAAQAAKTGDWSTQRERGNLLALKIIAWFALHAGRRFSRLILLPVVAYFYASSPKARRASMAFLSRIPDSNTGALAVFRHLYAFAAVTLDRVYFLNGRFDLFDVTVQDPGNQALGTATRGQGMFLMGAHMGSFESVRCIARQHPSLKMVLLMYEENARNIQRLLGAINPEAQQAIISLGQPSAMLEVRDQLKAGSLIGILADRSLDASGRVEVNFLGSPAEFPIGPFRLAALLKHPVFFMIGRYEGGRRYTIYLEPVADFSDVAPADRERAISAALKRYVELIERHCVQAPHNWFNFFDFWQKDA